MATFDEDDKCTACGHARSTTHVLVNNTAYLCMFPPDGDRTVADAVVTLIIESDLRSQ